MATLPGGLEITTPSESVSTLISSALATASNVTTSTITTGGTGTVVTGAGTQIAGLATTVGAVVAGQTGLNGATVSDGVVTTQVTTPANVALVTQGTAAPVTATEAQNYLQALVNAAAPGDQALTNMVNTIANGVNGQAAVRVAIVDSSAANTSGQVVLDVSGSNTNVVQAVVANGNNVVVNGATAVAAVGNGSFQVSGTQGVLVAGDGANQVISGGAGRDTLVGGGGIDSIVGGAGDIVGFNSVGNYTVSGSSNVVLNFGSVGVTSLNQLASLVTGVQQNGDATTYIFDNGVASITLVGINLGQVNFSFNANEYGYIYYPS